MAAAVKETLGVEVQVLEGGVGQFDVIVDGARILGKKNGVFPTDEEILEALGGLLAR